MTEVEDKTVFALLPAVRLLQLLLARQRVMAPAQQRLRVQDYNSHRGPRGTDEDWLQETGFPEAIAVSLHLTPLPLLLIGNPTVVF